MSIFVCGDIHSTLDINKLDPFIDREDLDENDYLIICGDTGICGFSREQERATREYLRELPMTILFVDGNHEGFDELLSYREDEWHGGKVHIIEPGMIHLMRGQVYDIDGKTFFAFGGAYSVDREYRELGRTWFEEELPSEDEYEEARRNLRIYDYKVDYIVTHTGPYEVVSELGYECHEEGLEQLRFFQELADTVDFQDWYFGHLHEDTDIENFHCRIDEVTQIG
ncbi:metallophosphoesterase family protein [Eubacterium sp. MSJ-33]|uniref:metallophosphoesterase family protein n=1 Tax=Eubacterium sp. MSJ-33 TaxID=2841528 RepID=UPI001C74B239|nr:metallophosphoesterase [Eubacterium sp. MSJ-33]QWT53111.1 metallophosphoesterase [Eubacterium sp. MSJ-33]